MTGLDLQACRSPERTGVSGGGRSALSQHEKVTGRAFDRQIGTTRKGDRYAECRIRTEFAFDRQFCYATGDREWSFGETRLGFKLAICLY